MAMRFSFEFGTPKPESVTRDVNGNWMYTMFSSKANHKDFKTYKAKLGAVLTNPATLKVFKLHCDLFSLGLPNKYENDKLVEKNYLKTIKSKPNHFQTWKQFYWDYKFWRMLGTGVLWRSNNVLTESTQMYWLNPANIDYENGKNRFSQFLFSLVNVNKQKDETIKYTFDDGKTTRIKIKELSFFFDLSNGLGGNWYEGNSTLDALYKVISNNESVLDAQNINLEFSQKFMVNGKTSIDDITALPMGETERQDIESSVRSNKKVHAVKTPIDVKRFVDDIASLKLDESYFNTAFIIGNIFNTPRDILELYIKGGSTYENQEKSMARMVEYCLKPAGDDLMEEFEFLFQLKDLRYEFSHLMFNQVFEKERQEVMKLKIENEVLAKTNNINTADL